MNNKINVVESERRTFWEHFRNHRGVHPAIDEHDQNPSSRWHQPIGIFGDDARYTLAGRKILILLLSSVLQKIERHWIFSRYVEYFILWWVSQIKIL